MSDDASINVVMLNPPIGETEAERRRFEKWASSMLTARERSLFLVRTIGGEYLLRTAQAGWAAWQARGLIDAKEKP